MTGTKPTSTLSYDILLKDTVRQADL